MQWVFYVIVGVPTWFVISMAVPKLNFWFQCFLVTIIVLLFEMIYKAIKRQASNSESQEPQTKKHESGSNSNE